MGAGGAALILLSMMPRVGRRGGGTPARRVGRHAGRARTRRTVGPGRDNGRVERVAGDHHRDTLDDSTVRYDTGAVGPRRAERFAGASTLAAKSDEFPASCSS